MYIPPSYSPSVVVGLLRVSGAIDPDTILMDETAGLVNYGRDYGVISIIHQCSSANLNQTNAYSSILTSACCVHPCSVCLDLLLLFLLCVCVCVCVSIKVVRVKVIFIPSVFKNIILEWPGWWCG